jgi:hypothetical protein
MKNDGVCCVAKLFFREGIVAEEAAEVVYFG